MTDEFEERLRAGLQRRSRDVTALDADPTAMAAAARSRARRRRWFVGAAAVLAAGGFVAVPGLVRPPTPPMIAVAPTRSAQSVDPHGGAATTPALSGPRNPTVGTTWTAEWLQGRALTGVAVAQRPWMRLDPDGTVSGHDGCAAFSGRYQLTGEELRFDALKRAAKPCPTHAPDADFLAALRATTWLNRAETSLELATKEGLARVRFHPVTDAPGSGVQGVTARLANVTGKDIVRAQLVMGRTRVSFGALRAGATSPSTRVAGAAYRYTGFDVTFADGTHQAVTVADYVGEEPLARGSYTYVLFAPASPDETFLRTGFEEEGTLTRS